MGKDHKLDFISSVLLTVLGAAILVASVGIYSRAGEPLHASPGLMPGALGAALLVTSLLLFRQSTREDGLRAVAGEAGAWLAGLVRHPDTRNTLIGVAMMAIYTFVLIHVLQFWLASLIFTIALLAFLRATKWYWILLIAGCTVGGIYLLFTTVFNVPLP